MLIMLKHSNTILKFEMIPSADNKSIGEDAFSLLHTCGDDVQTLIVVGRNKG